MGTMTEKAFDSLLPQEICEKFGFEDRLLSVKRLGEGHINRTLKVGVGDGSGGVSYIVVQRINTDIFKDPEGLMNNVFLVTDHIRKKAAESGLDPERATMRFLKTVDGEQFARDSRGGCWRAYVFIDRCVCYERVEKTEDFENAGVALGRFQKMLSDFPAEQLKETIPNFHNTLSRLDDFKKIIAEDPIGRLDGCREEAEFVLSRAGYCGRILERIASGEVPLRVTHNDTKLNNVLMDEATGQVLCLIDLDTVMPGSALYDFGDSIRFGASSAAEDERDLRKVYFVPELYDAYRKGYLSEAEDVLTEAEMELLPLSSIILTLECGMRFLGDHINGDTYFSISRENHNLDRARTQFKLVRDMEDYFGIRC